MLWKSFFKKSNKWPEHKAARAVMYSLMTPEQIKAYQATGKFKLPDAQGRWGVVMGYGQHWNLLFNNEAWCGLVKGPLYNSPPEVTMVSQLLLLRLGTGFFTKVAGGHPAGSNFYSQFHFIYTTMRGEKEICGHYSHAEEKVILGSYF